MHGYTVQVENLINSNLRGQVMLAEGGLLLSMPLSGMAIFSCVPVKRYFLLTELPL